MKCVYTHLYTYKGSGAILPEAKIFSEVKCSKEEEKKITIGNMSKICSNDKRENFLFTRLIHCTVKSTLDSGKPH